MQPAKAIDIYTPEGILLFKAVITDINIVIPEAPSSDQKQPSKPEKGDAKSNGEAVSDAQKRLLFRLVVTLYKLDGDQAFGKLKELFGVPSLRQVTKKEASKMIERLLAEEKEAKT